MRVEIKMKLPSANDYIDVCRTNRFKAAQFKRNVENQIALFLKRLPRFEQPIRIRFHWIEENKRRDLDNIAFAKKFILDTLVKLGKLKDDNRKCVTMFTDTFAYGDEAKVILDIREDKGDKDGCIHC